MPGPQEESELVSDLSQGELLSPALRSRILELISSARMLGKAELLAELATDADPSVRREFEYRLKTARVELEGFLAEELWRREPDVLEGRAERLPLVAELPDPAPQPAFAMALQPEEPAFRPSGTPAAAAVLAEHSDWDAEKPRLMVPAFLLAVVALGFAAYWAYGGLLGNSSAFQFYMERQRCLAVSDALIDLRNGRPARLPDSRDALMREESACMQRNLYSSSGR